MSDPVEQFAISYSDGSFNVLAESRDHEHAAREMGFDDTDPGMRLVRVRVDVIEEIAVKSQRQLPASVEAGGLIAKAQDLSCDDQFAIATAVAANVGYVLKPEPIIP